MDGNFLEWLGLAISGAYPGLVLNSTCRIPRRAVLVRFIEQVHCRALDSETQREESRREIEGLKVVNAIIDKKQR